MWKTIVEIDHESSGGETLGEFKMNRMEVAAAVLGTTTMLGNSTEYQTTIYVASSTRPVPCPGIP